MRHACTALAVVVCAAGTAAADSYRILDPLAVRADGDAASAVIEAAKPARMDRLRCDAVVAGGGLGGVAAALAALRGGLRVCLTEATNWLGGQMTSQGVSALDENQWIETTGATRSYQDLRRRIRAAYEPMLQPGEGGQPRLNPGSCWVSALCFEAKTGVAVIEDLLAPYRKSGALRVMMRSAPVEARRQGGRLRAIVVYDFAARRFTELEGAIFIDATELGELLPLAGAGFRAGADARGETGEPDADDAANPDMLQSFTYPFVIARTPADSVTISKPAGYDRDRRQFRLVVDYSGGRSLRYGVFENVPGTPGSFWTYRRLIDAALFQPGSFASDLAMINWPGNDVCDPGYLSPDPLTAARALQHGKQVALGFAWWLQHEAPHDAGGGAGFPGLFMRANLLGSPDGLSQYPYIREARRMAALATVREQDVAEPWQPGARGAAFEDTAGIGSYAIDIHGCAKAVKALPRSKPYQIPFGALISRDVPNLLAGGKNIGTTHVTNGAYRLHPVEWAIGEASGTLAAWAVRHRREPARVYKDRGALRAVQRRLLAAGHPLVWFDDVTPEEPSFAEIQFAALAGLMPPANDSLHFRPRDAVAGAEAVLALRKLGSPVPEGMPPSGAIEWAQLATLGHGAERRNGPVSRADFALWLSSWNAGALFGPPDRRML